MARSWEDAFRSTCPPSWDPSLTDTQWTAAEALLREVALDWAGCSEGRAAEVTQACAACMALSWLLGLLWAFWLHPVATPTAAKAVGSVVIHLDGSVAGLLWAALRCVGTLGVISLLLTHWAAASALTLSLLWPSVTLSWLLLCCTCSFLDLGTGAEDSD